jgi:hypothetical protein
MWQLQASTAMAKASPRSAFIVAHYDRLFNRRYFLFSALRLFFCPLGEPFFQTELQRGSVAFGWCALDTAITSSVVRRNENEMHARPSRSTSFRIWRFCTAFNRTWPIFFNPLQAPSNSQLAASWT